jgi:hypothetical protein
MFVMQKVLEQLIFESYARNIGAVIHYLNTIELKDNICKDCDQSQSI